MKDIDINTFALNSDDFEKGFLITAGTLGNYNMMTAGWGGIGTFWSKPALTVYVRDTRLTYKFMNDNEYFTCSFYGDEYKDMLRFCGSRSGRDFNKAEECNLTPVEVYGQVLSFKEAKITLVCRKLCHFDLTEDNFDDLEHGRAVYPLKDYHRGYIAEIVKIYSEE